MPTIHAIHPKLAAILGGMVVLVGGFFWWHTVYAPDGDPEPSDRIVSQEDQQQAYVRALDDTLAVLKKMGYDAATIDAFLFDTRVPAVYRDAHLDLTLQLQALESQYVPDILALFMAHREAL